jgi:hypothetical protein
MGKKLVLDSRVKIEYLKMKINMEHGTLNPEPKTNYWFTCPARR